MASEAPSWADQWGAGGIGAMEEAIDSRTKSDDKSKKGNGKGGFGRAKAATAAGAQKIKSGAVSGIRWVKNQFQKKKPSK